MSAAAQPAPPPFTPTLAGRTVLVIEDHRDSREMLTAVLRSLQAQVVEARNIEEAEFEMQVHRPHLIMVKPVNLDQFCTTAVALAQR